MTKDNEQNLSDAELEAYLEGRHEVSDTYAALDKATSPASLDAQILSKARESVSEDQQADTDVYYRPYAIAATVLVSFAITFMLVNESPEQAMSPFTDSDTIGQRSASAPQEQLTTQQAARTALQDAPAAPAVAEIQAEALAETPATTGTAAIRNENTNGAVQALAPVLEVESDAQFRQAAESADSNELREATNLAEIIDPAAGLANQPDHRLARDTWLTEIQRLRDSGNEEQAELEGQLFLESYPGSNLEELLQEVAEQ